MCSCVKRSIVGESEIMCKTEEYYTENEVKEMVDDMESLNEYLYGIYGAIKKRKL